MIAGGVAANKQIREGLIEGCHKRSLPLFAPKLKYTGDNAAMIATAAYYNIKNKKARILKGKQIFNLIPNSNWQLIKNKL